MFQCISIDKVNDAQTVTLTHLADSELPEGDVLVNVAWTTMNYKDALAITGSSPVVRRFPMVPGIDFSGIVEESAHPDFKPGDKVVLNGWSVGEKYWGGYSEKARVKGDWLIHLPDGISMKRAMSVGTAGYTAMLCVQTLAKHGQTADKGPVVVTGATGGVGSVATMLLAGRGYTVEAVTGRPSEEAYLKDLGAASIVDRAEVSGKIRPLAKERWAGAVDVVGTTVLANVLSAIKYRGVVAACGLAGGMDLPTSVAPFILRGVTLAGVDSVMCPLPERREAWQALAKELDFDKLDSLSTEIALKDVIEAAPKMLAGQIRGRFIIPINPGLE